MVLSSLNKTRANQNAVETAGQKRIIQSSLALKMLCQSLRADKSYTILDLGPAVQENINFYSLYARKICIEDIYESLMSSASCMPDEADSSSAIVERTPPYSETTRFDLIFAWDLFHYLSREQLKNLIAHLNKFCNRGAILFSLTTSSQFVADKPIGFRILDQENLTLPPAASNSCANARYREPNLSRLMQGFKVHKTFLLRNGMQEHLFMFSNDQ